MRLAVERATINNTRFQMLIERVRLARIVDLNAPDLESSIKAMKGNLARIAPEEERLLKREATLNTDLQAAQSKLGELNSQLDALMSELKGP